MGSAPVTGASKVHPTNLCRLLHFLKTSCAGAGYIFECCVRLVFATQSALKKTELKLSSKRVQTWQLKANPEPPLQYRIWGKKELVPVLGPAPVTGASTVHPSQLCRILHFLKISVAGAGYIFECCVRLVFSTRSALKNCVFDRKVFEKQLKAKYNFNKDLSKKYVVNTRVEAATLIYGLASAFFGQSAAH